MINTGFVHALDEDYMTESVYRENERDINQILSDMYLLNQQKSDLINFGLFTEAKEEFFTESVTEAITKLGERIIQIFADLKKRISDMFSKWKEKADWRAGNEKKIEMIARRDPKTAERVQIALQRGDLDMNSFKDIKQFFDECDKVLDDLEKRAIDPKSARGRWEAAKKKISNNQDNIKLACTLIGAVATAGTFYFSYSKFKKGNQNKLQKEATDLANEAAAKEKRIKHQIDVLKKMKDNNADVVSTCGILSQMANEISHLEDVNVRKRLNLISKVTDGFCRAFLKIGGKDPGETRNKNIDKKIKELEGEGERLRTVRAIQNGYRPESERTKEKSQKLKLDEQQRKKKQKRSSDYKGKKDKNKNGKGNGGGNS